MNNWEKSGIASTFSSLYHHYTKHLAERTIGPHKSLLKTCLHHTSFYFVPKIIFHCEVPEVLCNQDIQKGISLRGKSVVSSEEYSVLQQLSCNDELVLNSIQPVFLWEYFKKICEPAQVLNTYNSLQRELTEWTFVEMFITG